MGEGSVQCLLSFTRMSTTLNTHKPTFVHGIFTYMPAISWDAFHLFLCGSLPFSTIINSVGYYWRLPPMHILPAWTTDTVIQPYRDRLCPISSVIKWSAISGLVSPRQHTVFSLDSCGMPHRWFLAVDSGHVWILFSTWLRTESNCTRIHDDRKHVPCALVCEIDCLDLL